MSPSHAYQQDRGLRPKPKIIHHLPPRQQQKVRTSSSDSLSKAQEKWYRDPHLQFWASNVVAVATLVATVMLGIETNKLSRRLMERRQDDILEAECTEKDKQIARLQHQIHERDCKLHDIKGIPTRGMKPLLHNPQPRHPYSVQDPIPPQTRHISEERVKSRLQNYPNNGYFHQPGHEDHPKRDTHSFITLYEQAPRSPWADERGTRREF